MKLNITFHLQPSAGTLSILVRAELLGATDRCCILRQFSFSSVCVDPPSVMYLFVFQWGLLLSTTCVLLITRLQGQLTEGLDVVDYLMEQPNVVPRMNPLVLSTERQYLDFTANPGDPRRRVWCCVLGLLFSPPCLFFCCFTCNFSAVFSEWEDATMFSYVDVKDKIAITAKKMKYFAHKGKRSNMVHFEFQMVCSISFDIFMERT